MLIKMTDRELKLRFMKLQLEQMCMSGQHVGYIFDYGKKAFVRWDSHNEYVELLNEVNNKIAEEQDQLEE